MKQIRLFVKSFTIILFVLTIAIFSAVFYLSENLSENYKVPSGQLLEISSKIPVKATYTESSIAQGKVTNSVGSSYNVDLKIFGLIPVGKANVEIIDEMYVSVLGSPFGMKIYTDGVLIIALSEVDTNSGNISPASNCGLKIGDYILTLDGKKVYTNEDVSSIIEQSGGRALNIVINRNGKIKTLTLTPELSSSTNAYKAGIWVRDSSAGIGTLTFYYPTNNVICGLGHGICDKDTGGLLTVNSGQIVGVEIVSLKKAVSGEPGELTGRITLARFGDILLNSECGVYAKALNYQGNGELMPVALKQEIKNGEAVIITTISGNKPKEYSCDIKICNEKGVQNLIVKITDEELIAATGGILQGMSGSPIIQNGKLIGAVTHVLIDDATKGYGIFAENMLETAQSVAEEQKLKDAS